MALRETLETIRSVPDPKDEENAKFQIIAPILGDLGWNPARQEILYEHRVGGKARGSVDIALKGPNRLVALIEAKAPKESLADHVEQVLGYAFFEGVDICVLTNGLEWWLYLPREDGPPDERRFTTLLIKKNSIEQLADDFETFLAKNNLIEGQAKKRAKQVPDAKHQAAFLNAELPRVWKSMLDGPDDELVELVRQRTYEKVNLRPEPERVTAVIRGAPVPSIVPKEPYTPRVAPASKQPTRKRTTQPRASTRPTGFRLWGRHYEIRTWKDMLLQVAQALHQRYGTEFIDLLLEIQTTRGNPYASRNPRVFHAAGQIPSTDVYIETAMNAKNTTKRVHELLNLYHHPPSDLEILKEPLTPRVSPASKQPPRKRTTQPRASTRPTGFRLWGRRYEIRIWKDMLLQVAQALHQRYGTEFIDLLLDIRTTRGNPYASHNPREIREARQIPSTDVYLETNLSAKDITKRVHELLDLHHHPPSDLEIL